MDLIIPQIKMFLTDCDGCLTDGGMYYSENGDELKKFNTRDGMGFALLREHGIITGIITSESVALNRRRAKKLKLDILEEGCKDKASAVKRICSEYQVNLENIAYVGDDVNDLEVIQMVGLGCCPADAIASVKRVASFITEAKGGEGVIREVADKILEQ
ncbi:MAG: HAD-IIIA family hydrolase [Odoribacter sp.]|nr:HAD-IIIA family hydrolase [Odoribacter sp.]